MDFDKKQNSKEIDWNLSCSYTEAADLLTGAIDTNLKAWFSDIGNIKGIIQAAWYTKAQLAGEIVFPPPLIQHDWDQMRSENWQVECLPTRKANF